MTVHGIIFLIIKPTRCTNFSNLFWNETLHVSDSSSVHHQESSTVHTAMVYVIQVCRQLASRSICSCSQALSKPVWHIHVPLLCVQCKTPYGGQRNCPKHVEFHSKNEFEKLVHLVGYIIRQEKKKRFWYNVNIFYRFIIYDLQKIRIYTPWARPTEKGQNMSEF